MRLWHKSLIRDLPRQQLLGQWRECCLIAKNIRDKGTPGHLLVNKVMDYPIGHFHQYGLRVYDEMTNRGYNADLNKFDQYFDSNVTFYEVPFFELFKDWHNSKYLSQCLSNLEEKYDCGGITKEEWHKIIESACLLPPIGEALGIEIEPNYL